MSFSGIVSAAHSAIEGLAVVGGPALAIVLFTVLVRLLISPPGYLQVRAARRREALAPLVEELRGKLTDDPLALNTAVMELYRENGAGLMTGPLRLLPVLALPVVAWMPLAGALYLVTSTTWTAAEQALLRWTIS